MRHYPTCSILKGGRSLSVIVGMNITETQELFFCGTKKRELVLCPKNFSGSREIFTDSFRLEQPPLPPEFLDVAAGRADVLR